MNFLNAKTVHSNWKSVLHLIIYFSAIFLMSTPLFARYADSKEVLKDSAKTENQYLTLEKNSNSILVESAVDYAKGYYGIKISVADSLMAEHVPALVGAPVPLSQWISRVFKRFDKIVYYNDQFAVESLKIIGIKSGAGSARGQRPIFSAPLPDAIGILTEGRPSGVIVADSSNAVLAEQKVVISTGDAQQDEGLPEGVVIDAKSNSGQPPEGVVIDTKSNSGQPPEGVVIDTKSNSGHLPEGIQLPDQQSPDTNAPKGVQISDQHTQDTEAPEGVELPQ